MGLTANSNAICFGRRVIQNALCWKFAGKLQGYYWVLAIRFAIVRIAIIKIILAFSYLPLLKWRKKAENSTLFFSYNGSFFECSTNSWKKLGVIELIWMMSFFKYKCFVWELLWLNCNRKYKNLKSFIDTIIEEMVVKRKSTKLGCDRRSA